MSAFDYMYKELLICLDTYHIFVRINLTRRNKGVGKYEEKQREPEKRMFISIARWNDP